MTERVTPRRTLFFVWISLIVLTLATTELAFLNLGVWSTPIALGIAAAKAILVALFFMEARYSLGITRVAIFGGLLWLGLLIAGTMDDLITRGWLGIPGK